MRLLSPIPQDRRLRRFTQLLAGLLLYGLTMGLMVRAVLGLDPWDVFHQGLTALVNRWVPLSYGAVITIVSVLVLLLWIPLRQRPGLGTVSNVFAVGLAMDGTLALVPDVRSLALRIPLLVAGVVLNGVATGLYISARFGPGPRDGLMTGLNRRTGRSVRLVRTVLEVAVVATGFALGGTVGVGTVAFVILIGPSVEGSFWLLERSPLAATLEE
jgi:uncharacterized membrane protein YczE